MGNGWTSSRCSGSRTFPSGWLRPARSCRTSRWLKARTRRRRLRWRRLPWGQRTVWDEVLARVGIEEDLPFGPGGPADEFGLPDESHRVEPEQMEAVQDWLALAGVAVPAQLAAVLDTAAARARALSEDVELEVGQAANHYGLAIDEFAGVLRSWQVRQPDGATLWEQIAELLSIDPNLRLGPVDGQADWTDPDNLASDRQRAELESAVEVLPGGGSGGAGVVWLRAPQEAADTDFRQGVGRLVVPGGYVGVVVHGRDGRAYLGGVEVSAAVLAGVLRGLGLAGRPVYL